MRPIADIEHDKDACNNDLHGDDITRLCAEVANLTRSRDIARAAHEQSQTLNATLREELAAAATDRAAVVRAYGDAAGARRTAVVVIRDLTAALLATRAELANARTAMLAILELQREVAETQERLRVANAMHASLHSRHTALRMAIEATTLAVYAVDKPAEPADAHALRTDVLSLRAQLAAIDAARVEVAVPGWIPAHDPRRPSEGESVLAWRCFSNDVELQDVVGYRNGMFVDLSLWTEGNFPVRITHWQPLPLPPEAPNA